MTITLYKVALRANRLCALENTLASSEVLPRCKRESKGTTKRNGNKRTAVQA